MYSVHTVHSYVLIERHGVLGFGIIITSEQWKKTWLFRLYRGLYYPIPSYMGIVISQLQGFCHCIRASPMERFST